jgi:hypothetical protein
MLDLKKRHFKAVCDFRRGEAFTAATRFPI